MQRSNDKPNQEIIGDGDEIEEIHYEMYVHISFKSYGLFPLNSIR